MFGTIKNWLGIEGVKIEIRVDDQIDPKESVLNGSLLFYSKRPQTVESAEIKLIEKYIRGRKKSKLIDEYTLGSMQHDEAIDIPAEQFIELEFSLPFDVMQSDMDRYAEYNILTKYLVSVAKRIKNAKSQYRLEASAKVTGSAMKPFAKRPLYIDD